MNLSKRLQKIADMIPKCDVFADVGTDHGYLPIELVKANKADKAYAMDINRGPLKKAQRNIEKAMVTKEVTTILSNGLQHLPEDVSVVAIAGMGGMLIAQILEASELKLKGLDTLVLSPHLDLEALRRSIHKQGFIIEDESVVCDQEKYYPVIRCIKGKETYTELEYKYGKCNMSNKEAVWLDYMIREQEKLEVLMERLLGANSDNSRERIVELERTIKQIDEVISNE